MGWSSGTDIACEMIESINMHVKDDDVKIALYETLLAVLEEKDWDTQSEAMGIDPLFDEVVYTNYPEWREYE